jgi:hypothetical protein
MTSSSSVTETCSGWSLVTEECLDRLTYRLVRGGFTQVQYNFFLTDKDSRWEATLSRLLDEMRMKRFDTQTRCDIALGISVRFMSRGVL